MTARARGPLRRRALRDRSGVAALEFALIAPVLFLLLAAMIDFGYAFNVKLKITNAVTAAAHYAFQQGKSVSESDVPQLLSNTRNVVLQSVKLKALPTVTVFFNNSTAADSAANFYCVAGSPPIWRSTGSKSADCGGSIASGKYMTITASGASASFFFGHTAFGPLLDINDTITVRVE